MGHKKMVEDCIANRDKLQKLLSEVKGVKILPYAKYMNILPISAPEESIKKMPVNYQMRSDEIEGVNVYKLCILPHTFKFIEMFVVDIKKVMNM